MTGSVALKYMAFCQVYSFMYHVYKGHILFVPRVVSILVDSFTVLVFAICLVQGWSSQTYLSLCLHLSNSLPIALHCGDLSHNTVVHLLVAPLYTGHPSIVVTHLCHYYCKCSKFCLSPKATSLLWSQILDKQGGGIRGGTTV